MMAIQSGRVQKNKPHGKTKRKEKAELMKKKKTRGQNVASTSSGIYTIELFAFPKNSWVYDTGCGTHICNTKQGLRGAKKLKRGSLYLYVGNWGVVLVSHLVNKGFTHCFTDFGLSVSMNNMIYFNAITVNGIYEIDMRDSTLPIVNSMYSISNKRTKPNLDSSYLWHCRLAHINKKRIEKLQHDGLLKPTDNEPFDQCVSCISGKMTRKPFSHKTEKVKDVLGLIHTDVCGPLRHVSKKGASYFITFTDDYSRYGYVYLLKHKHEVFETFKIFKNEVENQLGKTIKAIRSDRGGEYISQEFKDYLKAYGIVQQLTPPYTPQHNGVSERRNRTLLNMVRSMMSLTTLPLSFWDYALESAARILNMVPTKKVDKTPDRSRSTALQYWKFKSTIYGDLNEPIIIQIALSDPEFEKWLVAMNEEIQSMNDNNVWKLVGFHQMPKVVKSLDPTKKKTRIRMARKQIFKKRTKTKLKRTKPSTEWKRQSQIEAKVSQSQKVNRKVNPDKVKEESKVKNTTPRTEVVKSSNSNHKDSFCKYSNMVEGLFLPSLKSYSPQGLAVQTLIAIAAFYNYEIWQMEVKIAFLNGLLEEEIYMEQPEGFIDPNHPRKVYEPCVYQKASGSNVIFLILYVDDIILMGNHIPSLQEVKTYLGKCFSMKDLGEAAFILGIKIYRDRSRRLIGLSQNAYLDKILKRYRMDNSKRGSIPMQVDLHLSKSQCATTSAEMKRMQNVPYASAVGSIMYAVRCTRPDVAFAQNITSRFQQNSGEAHWTAVKNILKYLRNTKDTFLVYGGNPEAELRVNCYCDAGFETDRDDTKSQTGYVFVLNGGAVVWKSSKQSTTAQHATEAEYIAASEAAKEAVWIRKFIDELGVVPSNDYPIKMNCDNSAAIIMAKESGIQKGARHFKRKYHYVRECIETGEIDIVKVHTDDNLADPFTKALAGPKLTRHARSMGLRPASSFM
ncbi:retrotransposon protein, putative, ty1-copia subclass [Tanacetum coccineum]